MATRCLFQLPHWKGAGTGWDMKEEVDAALRFIHRPNPTILDVGANVGMWSEMLLKNLPDAQVFMCEPAPTSQVQIKKRNLRATLIPYAVGETSENAVLYSSRDCDGSDSLHKRVDSYFSTRDYEPIDVQTTTIDQISASNGLEFHRLHQDGH